MSCNLNCNCAKRPVFSLTNSWMPWLPRLDSPSQAGEEEHGELKKGAQWDQGKRRPSCCAPPVGWSNPCQEQRGRATGSPAVPTPATVTPVHRALFYMALKLAAERQTGLFNILPQFWERVHSSGLLLPSISMLGRCRKDSEQSGLEGMRPRFGCHGTLKHRVPVADEGTS